MSEYNKIEYWQANVFSWISARLCFRIVLHQGYWWDSGTEGRSDLFKILELGCVGLRLEHSLALDFLTMQHLHFVDGETKKWRLSNLSKVTTTVQGIAHLPT